MSVPYYGDFADNDTVNIPFNTFSSNDPAASVTATDLADADIFVHKDGSATAITTDGATIDIDAPGVGAHMITIDTNADVAYVTGSEYAVRVDGVTVDGGTINAWVNNYTDIIGTMDAAAFGTDFLTAAKIADGAFVAANFAASSLDGKGNWNIGKTGYALTTADWNVGKTGYSLTGTTGLGAQTANITGNLSGSVGSVSGAVGSVTGAVGSVTGTTTHLIAATTSLIFLGMSQFM